MVKVSTSGVMTLNLGRLGGGHHQNG